MSKKLTKGALKEIVKECLVEILQEGFGNNLNEQLNRRSYSASELSVQNNYDTSLQLQEQIRRPALDNVRFNTKKEKINENFDRNTSSAIGQMTSDPILAEILSDTARTTLQSQLAGERKGPGGTSLPTSHAGDHAARTVAQSDLLDLFGDSSKNWANLAFNK